MSLTQIKETLPIYAKDLKLNLSSILTGVPALTEAQCWGVLLAVAIACQQKTVLHAVAKEAETHLSPEMLNAAKGAAAIMAMNNIYYRFTHMVSNHSYSSMPANLRMNIIGQPGIDKVDFELMSLAVSAINGCGLCMDSHEKTLIKHNISPETIQAAIRVAAVLHGIATVVATEETLTLEKG